MRPHSLRSLLPILLAGCFAVGLRAQAPDPGQGTWDGKCYDNQGHVKPCGSSSSSGSSSNSNGSIDWAAARAAARARKEAKEEKKREEEQAKALEKQQEEQKKAAEDAERIAEQLREEAARKQAEAVAAFNAGKTGMLTDLKGIDADPSVVDLTELKDLSGATVPDLHGGNQTPWLDQITDSDLQPIARRIDAVVPPLPIPAKEAPTTFTNLVLSHSEGILTANDYVWAAWDMLAPAGKATALPEKVILIAGKTFIAGEDGAAIYLAQKQEDYDAALRYLKDPEKAKQFAKIVEKLREGRPGSPFDDPEMVRVAAALADPKLNRSGAAIAWDAMISPPAVAAMLRKATIEITSEVVSDKANETLAEVTAHKEAFDAVKRDRDYAVLLYRNTHNLDRIHELDAVIQHANQRMADMYRVEAVSSGVVGVSIGDATDKLADKMLGKEPEAGEEK
jgi:hypothetical protein